MRKIFRILIYIFTVISLLLLLTMLFYLFNEALPFFKEENIIKFIIGKKWYASYPEQSFQIYNMLIAGIYISFLACIISFFISYGLSLFICFYTNKKIKAIILWIINILAGIPSIIYGFFGMKIILKKVETIFNLSSGESILAGSLILSIMIIPFFVRNCIENMEMISKKYKKYSDCLGIKKEYFIGEIVFRENKISIIISFLLAFGRATGETMAVMMVIGNAPITPKLLQKAQTIPTLIALEIGMSEVGSKHYSALFASAFILLILVLFINIIASILNKLRRKYVEN